MSNTSRMMQTAAAGLPGDRWTLNDVKRSFAPLGQIILGTDVEQVVWKADGSSYFFIDNSSFLSVVFEYSGAAAWETHPATFLKSKSLGTSQMYGLFFKPDGTKMYTTDQVGDDVKEWDLSTAWDINTASYTQSYTLGFSGDDPVCLFFSPDGLNMFVSRNGATDAIYSYSLSTAWDISSASPVTSFGYTDVWGFAFDDTGTQMFFADSGYGTIYFRKYVLSVAWDLSTATSNALFNDATWYANGGLSSPNFSKNARYILFGDSGNRMYVSISEGIDRGLYNYDLASAYTFSGYSRQLAASNYYDFPGLNTTTNNGKGGLCFSTDGTKMYVVDSYTSTIDQFDLSAPYNISTASYASQITSAYDNDVAISRDGTKLFALLGSSIQTYTLGTPFDLSTASLTSTDTLPSGLSFSTLFIREDGLKLYCAYDDTFYQYTLGTAYDISTASLDGSSSNGALGFTYGMRINSTGTKMIALEFLFSSFRVRELSLAASWDLTSAPTLDSTYQLSPDIGGWELNGPRGLDVSPDGSYLFLPMRGMDLLLQYTLK